MDALSDVLRAVRLTGAFFFDVHAAHRGARKRLSARPSWTRCFPGSDHLICYHLLMEGTCWATLEGEEPIKLFAGDIIVLPHGDTHVLATAPGMRKTPEMSMYRMPERRQVAVEDLGRQPTAASRRTSSAASSAATRALTTRCSRRCRASSSSTITPAARSARTSARRWRSRKSGRMGSADLLGRISELMFVDVVRRISSRCPPIASTGSRACAINMSAAR